MQKYSAIKNFASNNFVLSKIISIIYMLTQACMSVPYRFLASIKNHISLGVKVCGWKSIFLGGNVAISHGSWLNVNLRNGSSFISIGENTFIGRNNFFSAGSSIKVGAFCLTAQNCSFIGSSHNIGNPLVPYIQTGVELDKEIIIGANCFFGFGASVLGDVKIGHGCVIGAHTVVMTDIPPFSVVIGNPGRVVKRFDFTESKWVRGHIGLEHPLDENEYIDILKKSSNGKFPFMPLSVSKGFFCDIP